MYSRPGPQTLGDYARDYCLFHDIRTESHRQLLIAAKLFERWAGRPVPLVELDAASVSAFLRDYSATVRPYTVRSKRVQILSLWRAAADEGLCDPPLRRVRTVRCPQPIVECWTHAEVDQLLATCRTLKRWHRCGLHRSVWWDLAVRVAFDSGLRFGDQMRLPVAAIRLDGLCPWQQSKTGRVVLFELSATTMAALRASLDVCQRELVTPWPGSHESFTDQVRLLVQKSGIRPGTWKWLRRSSATDVELQERGGAAEQLGHAPGSRIAYQSYVSPAIVGRRAVTPRPLTTPLPPIVSR